MISKQTQIVLWWLGGFFAFFAIVIMSGFYYFYTVVKDFDKNGVRTKGTVVDYEISYSKNNNKIYAPKVEFIDRNGEKVIMVSKTFASPPSYQIGERVDVVYLKNNSKEAEIDGFDELWFPVYLTGILGSIFSIVSVILLSVAYVNVRDRKYIKNHGIKIKAKIEGIEQNLSIKVNNRHPYRIKASYYDEKTQKKYKFLSDEYFKDLAGYVNGKECVEVWVLPDNYEKYVVDTSFVKSK